MQPFQGFFKGGYNLCPAVSTTWNDENKISFSPPAGVFFQLPED